MVFEARARTGICLHGLIITADVEDKRGGGGLGVRSVSRSFRPHNGPSCFNWMAFYRRFDTAAVVEASAFADSVEATHINFHLAVCVCLCFRVCASTGIGSASEDCRFGEM